MLNNQTFTWCCTLLGVHYAAYRKLPFKNVQLWQYLAKKLSFICIWVSTNSFCFQSYFGKPFHCVSSPLNYEETDFPKKSFSWGTHFVGKLCKGIALYGGTNDQIIPRGKEFHKMHFPVIWTLWIWKLFPTMVGYLLEDKALTIL